MRCFTSLALAGAFGMLAVAAAQAADIAFPPMEGLPEVSEQPVEFGTGWYLRGDAGWGRDRVPALSADTTLNSQSGLQNGYSFDLGFGYKLNNWLRSDVTFDYYKPQLATATGATNIDCQYGLVGYTLGTTEVGYLFNPNDTCTQRDSATVTREDLLLNAYVDLGTWGGITPYVGAGAGGVRTRIDGTENFYENVNGTLYAANLTPTGTFPPVWVNSVGNALTPQPAISFTQQNPNKSLHSTSYHLAWALMGGFAIDITDHLKVDVGYRYVNLGTFSGFSSSTGQAFKEKQSTQDVRLGFRYMVD